jgi:GTP-binding protein
MSPLLDTLVQHIPAPKPHLEEPFAFCVAMIERDPFVGRIATGEEGGSFMLGF